MFEGFQWNILTVMYRLAHFAFDCRPSILEFRGCSNVQISDVTVFNSPWWGLHPVNCSGFRVEGVRMHSPPKRPGAHGIVLDSSRDVYINRTGIITGAASPLYCHYLATVSCWEGVPMASQICI